jgi:tRNA dimethylallyltransferase
MLQQLLSEIKNIPPEKVPLIIIMGPTASGKSSIAMQIGEKLPIEIISADSMQIYRGMDIGVAKPSKRDQELIPHHLIDLLDISEPINVFKYVELANLAICEIRKNNKIPLLVGGSGMYIRALIYGLDPLPADTKLRRELDDEFNSPVGFEKLKTLMKKVDPEDFQRWSKHQRKLIRALEVFRITGKSITELQKTWDSGVLFPVNAWRIVIQREILRQRIAERTNEMLNNGWIEETENLIQNGLLTTPTARQAIGYPVIADFLDGKIEREAMRDKIVTVTSQFARRQDTWFRNKHPEAKNWEV